MFISMESRLEGCRTSLGAYLRIQFMKPFKFAELAKMYARIFWKGIDTKISLNPLRNCSNPAIGGVAELGGRDELSGFEP